MTALAVDCAVDRYVSLATFRRDGRQVRTPVWIAGSAMTGYVFSAGEAGKVKRLRACPRAQLARCDVSGRLLGPWVEARARLLTRPEDIAAAYHHLRQKYGWQMWLADVLSRLAGRHDRRQLIELTLTQEAPRT